jgi:hypothetical protein
MSSGDGKRQESGGSSTSGGSGGNHQHRRGGRGNRARHGHKKHGGNSHSSIALTSEDVEFLRRNTRYDENEIREWYKGFKVRRNGSSLGAYFG